VEEEEEEEEEEGGYDFSSRLKPGGFFYIGGLSGICEGRRMRLQYSRFICRRLEVTDTIYVP